MANSADQCRNVHGAFAVTGPVPPGRVLLVDDSADFKWTLTVVGALLRQAGVGAVYPLVLLGAARTNTVDSLMAVASGQEAAGSIRPSASPTSCPAKPQVRCVSLSRSCFASSCLFMLPCLAGLRLVS